MAIGRARASRAALLALLTVTAASPVVVANHVAGVAARQHVSKHQGAAVSAAGRAHAKGQRDPRRNPHHNRAPKPNYAPVCSQRGYRNHRCMKMELAAIRNARKHENVKRPRLVLPHNFRHLTTGEQIFVITNLERVSRGLRPFRGLTQRLSNIARSSARSNTDPMLATTLMRTLHIYYYGSIWASDLGPLGADYDWMYNDGYSKDGINIACPSPGADGCWGHRDNILGSYGGLPVLTAGAGTSTPIGRSMTEVLAGGNGAAPHMTYTWKRAVAHGANRHHHRKHRAHR